MQATAQWKSQEYYGTSRQTLQDKSLNFSQFVEDQNDPSI